MEDVAHPAHVLGLLCSHFLQWATSNEEMILRFFCQSFKYVAHNQRKASSAQRQAPRQQGRGRAGPAEGARGAGHPGGHIAHDLHRHVEGPLPSPCHGFHQASTLHGKKTNKVLRRSAWHICKHRRWAAAERGQADFNALETLIPSHSELPRSRSSAAMWRMWTCAASTTCTLARPRCPRLCPHA